MPGADTVWLTPLDEMLALLQGAGLTVRWQEESERVAPRVADSLIDAFAADAAAISAQIGSETLDGPLVSHRLWSDWLRDGRVRKFAFVADGSA